MSVTVAPTASEELTPIAPPRRKRAHSAPKQDEIGLNVETSSCNKDSAATKCSERSSPLPKPSDIDPSKKESSSDSTNSRSSIAVKPQREKLIKSTSLPRIENYYTRTGPEIRRETSLSPANVLSLYSLPQSSCTTIASAAEKSATPSPTHGAAPAVEKARSKPSVRPYAGKGIAPSSSHPRRPPKPPAPYNSCTNKTAPFSQLYDTAGSSTATVVVINSKSVDTGSERSLSAAPRSYGKMSGSHMSSQSSNRDDASIVYGKKMQVALSKLVATVKRFQGSGSGSSCNQNTTSVRKSNANKTPPKRPPPAVRNTPRPPIPKTIPSGSDVSPCATCGVDDSEENPYVNSYDDHIYMEVGKMAFKSKMREGSGSGIEEGDEEDPYVIMNPGDNSHIYTPLLFATRSKSTAVYDVPQVSRTDKKCASTSLEASGYLDDDNSYISPEELKRYQVVTTVNVGDEELDNCSAVEDDEETYVNMSCGKDDATVNYKSAAAIEGSKQNSDGKLSPTKSLTPTHRIVTDR